MSERGVFAMDRGWFEHSKFKAEPFTEREAWAWLISEAAWKPRVRRIAAFTLDLKRGQLAASTRFMAEKWQWSEASVRRFLARISDNAKSDALIDAASDAGITVITIRKYATYQRVSLPRDAENDAPKDADVTQTRRNTENIKVIEGSAGSSRDVRTLPTSDQILSVFGIDPTDPPLGMCGLPNFVEKCLGAGYSPDVMIAEARACLVRLRGPPDSFKYFDKPFARAHAEHIAPLADVKIIPAQTLEVRRAAKSQNTPADGIRAVREKLLGGTPGVRAGPGRDDVRPFPQGGGERP